MVTELGADVWWVDLRGVNAFLVDDDTLTLVDVGNPWDGGNLRKAIVAAGFEPDDVERVFLTHYDFDHVGGFRGLTDLDATVYVGAADAPLVRKDQGADWRNHKGFLQALFGPFLSEPGGPVQGVEDGDEIGSFTVYHTPGHTPGHVAYVSEDLDVAFLGDLVIERGRSLAASPWLMSYDVDAVKASIREFAGRAPPVSIVGMGHGTPIVDDGSERLAALVDSL